MAKTSKKTVENKVDIEDVNFNVDEIKENIENLNTEFPSNDDAIEEIKEKINKAIEPIEVLNKEVNDLTNNSSLNDLSQKTEDETAQILEKEIKKAEDLKKKVEKTIKTMTPQNMTNWWNGMGYDM